VADFAEEFHPRIIILENARELLTGTFSMHYEALRARLERLGYKVHGATHFLKQFGLPQERERAIVVAARSELQLRTLEQLWDGYRVRKEATHVRRAISHLPIVKAGVPHPSDPLHVSTDFRDEVARKRIRAIPHDGGSWNDLINHPKAKELLIPVMWRAIEIGRSNSHCDVYGRMWWDRPAPTIKRECAHVGNGRYAHPEQDRLCTVREMAILQGFPRNYKFVARSRKNMYRHIGDAVPPLISYQLAHLVAWILTGRKPAIQDIVLQGTHLHVDDIRPDIETLPLFARAAV
jgi:DNA (cytosine-5)-methyltransferase 1